MTHGYTLQTRRHIQNNCNWVLSYFGELGQRIVKSPLVSRTAMFWNTTWLMMLHHFKHHEPQPCQIEWEIIRRVFESCARTLDVCELLWLYNIAFGCYTRKKRKINMSIMLCDRLSIVRDSSLVTVQVNNLQLLHIISVIYSHYTSLSLYTILYSVQWMLRSCIYAFVVCSICPFVVRVARALKLSQEVKMRRRRQQRDVLSAHVCSSAHHTVLVT